MTVHDTYLENGLDAVAPSADDTVAPSADDTVAPSADDTVAPSADDTVRGQLFRDWLERSRAGHDDWDDERTGVGRFRESVEGRFAPRRVRPWSRPEPDPTSDTAQVPADQPVIPLPERRRMALERLKVTEKPKRRESRLNLFGSKRTPFWDVQRGPAPIGYYVLAVIVTLFVMLGLVMVLSASAQTEASRGRSPFGIFWRQLMWSGLGAIGLLVAIRISLTWLRRLAVPLLLLAGAGMIAPFVPGLGVTLNDARAWIAVGNLTMQPSEFLKLALVIYAADLLVRRKDDLSDVRRSLKPLVLLAAVVGILSLAQGDLGSAIVMTAIILAVAFIGGVPLIPLLATGATGAGAALTFVLSSRRRFDRFTAFLDIEAHKDRLSYQVNQSLLAIADGGLTGSGVGAGNGKMGYLPLAHSDFIFAVVADELGFIGSVAVLGGFAVLIWFGIQAALSAPDRFGMLLAGGIAAWFGVQAFINTGGVTGVLPVTGLTLPFFSAGGSSLFISMTAAGLLLNVARRGQLAKSRDRD